ncbi:hypothetical protein SIO17_17060 [Pseudoalteromonas piscicida]|uniref:imm11 family protein n=1 Tax=Pseudoalteromonas piscicida TaxID=43662 RepID=UPI00026D0198|nr:DUF1629 domain-containing protein [Pseudoalteromonas piscicida]WPU30777.1 hypothetical protein SIO17_17060 [Pseudoalteromonas piscicida]
MSKNYNEEYYILLTDYNENTLYTIPLERSATRHFGIKKLNWGDEPIFFENCYKERDALNNFTRPITDVFFDATVPIINSRIRDKLKFLYLKDMQLYPAVFINDEGAYIEDYWYMNFWQELDCWDREKSKIETFTAEEMVDPDYLEDCEIYKYHLDSEVLDNIPEEERLIFKQAGGVKYIFVHQTVADIFFEEKATGVNLVKVSDFEEGMQF